MSVLKSVMVVMAVIAVSVGLLELSPLTAQASPTASRSFFPDPVDAGGKVTVTITADGYGAFGDVVETLPPGFTYLNSSLPANQVERDGQTVTFALIGGTPPTTFRYTVTASSGEGDHSFTGDFSGVDTGFEAFKGVKVGGDPKIEVAATTMPPDTGDGDTGNGDTGATPPPTANRSFSPDPVDAGGKVTVEIIAEGHGSFGEVVERLPRGFIYLDSSLPTDQVTRSGQTVSGETVTLSLVGATSPTTFTYTVTASSVEGDHSFMGDFSGVESDFAPFSGVKVGGDPSIAVGPPAGPNAKRSFSPASVASRGRVTVTIIAEGHGSFGEVAETLPAGFTYLESSLPDDQVTRSGQTVTLTLVGATSPTTFTYTVRASSVAGAQPFAGLFSGVKADFAPFSGVKVGGDPSVTVRRPTTSSGSSGGTTRRPTSTPVPTATPTPAPTPTPQPTATATPAATATPMPTPEPGPPGAMGERGPAGPTGATGPAGPMGDAGQAGPEGDRGPQGVQGEQGGQGDEGAQGEQGAQGARGGQGEEGDQGPPGPQGAAGAQGDPGAKGDTGPMGDQGGIGEKGPAGGVLGIVALVISILVAVLLGVGGVYIISRR